MNVAFSENARKQKGKLDRVVLEKLFKQLKLLSQNPNYPSLRSRRTSGEDRYEARIDYHYRFTYSREKGIFLILSVGPHDKGLGKK